MVWWRKRNDGFEWRDYVRTTILVRRENRRQRIKAAKGAAAEQIKHVGQRGVEASVAGAQAARAAAWRHGRSAVGRAAAFAAGGTRATGRTAYAAASWLGAAFASIGGRIGQPLAPMLEPVLAASRPPRMQMGLLAMALVAGLGAAYRAWSFGFDADSRVAALVAGLAALVLVAARLTDPDRTPFVRAREGVLARLAGVVPSLRAASLASGTPTIAALALTAVGVIGALWFLLADGGTNTHAGAPLTTAALPERDPLKLEGRAVAVSGAALRISGRLVVLDGIEAPEASQTCPRPAGTWRCGAAAKDALAALIRNRRIACDVTDAGSTPPLARCFAQERDIAEELVRTGSVFSSEGFLARYSGAESEAQDAKAGIWAGEPERPQDFRDKRWAEAKRSAPEGCPIKGRLRAGAKSYVLPWASGYDGIRLRTSRGDRWFCSEAEARQAGWHPDAPS